MLGAVFLFVGQSVLPSPGLLRAEDVSGDSRAVAVAQATPAVAVAAMGTAWVLSSAVLVLLKTPALAFFYGGLVPVFSTGAFGKSNGPGEHVKNSPAVKCGRYEVCRFQRRIILERIELILHGFPAQPHKLYAIYF